MFKHINKPGKQVFTTECTAAQSGAQNNFRGETLSRSAHIHTSAALSLMSTNGLATAGQLEIAWSESKSGMCGIIYSMHILFQMNRKLFAAIPWVQQAQWYYVAPENRLTSVNITNVTTCLHRERAGGDICVRRFRRYLLWCSHGTADKFLHYYAAMRV